MNCYNVMQRNSTTKRKFQWKNKSLSHQNKALTCQRTGWFRGSEPKHQKIHEGVTAMYDITARYKVIYEKNKSYGTNITVEVPTQCRDIPFSLFVVL